MTSSLKRLLFPLPAVVHRTGGLPTFICPEIPTPKTKIVISVYGGNVQDVFCSDPQAEVVVVDWDTEGCDASDDGCVAVLDNFGQRRLARICHTTAEPLAALAKTPVAAALDRAGVIHPMR